VHARTYFRVRSDASGSVGRPRDAQGLKSSQSRCRPVVGRKPKEAYSSGLANLVAALSNWAALRSGRRRPTHQVPPAQDQEIPSVVPLHHLCIRAPTAQIGATSSCPASDWFASTNQPGTGPPCRGRYCPAPFGDYFLCPRALVRVVLRRGAEGGTCRHRLPSWWVWISV
jgi:hypothetical protein